MQMEVQVQIQNANWKMQVDYRALHWFSALAVYQFNALPH
jgi:hypothetical protein